MKKIQFMGYEPQEIPEVETLSEISKNGLYAVKGFPRAVEAQVVTQYGKDSLSERYGNSIRFFIGADGREYYALVTGAEFLESISQELMDRIAVYMDGEKREQVHRELAPCSPEAFLARYCELDPEFENLLKSEFSIEL